MFRALTVMDIKTVMKIRLILIKIRAGSGAGIGAQPDQDHGTVGHTVVLFYR